MVSCCQSKIEMAILYLARLAWFCCMLEYVLRTLDALESVGIELRALLFSVFRESYFHDPS